MASMADSVLHKKFTGTSIGLGEEELDQMSMNRAKPCGVTTETDPGIFAHLRAGLLHAKRE
jgi:hypothetical protein